MARIGLDDVHAAAGQQLAVGRYHHLFELGALQQELGLGVVAIAGIADDADEVVELREGDEVARELFGVDLRLIEQEAAVTVGAGDEGIAGVRVERQGATGHLLRAVEQCRQRGFVEPAQDQHLDEQAGDRRRQEACRQRQQPQADSAIPRQGARFDGSNRCSLD